MKIKVSDYVADFLANNGIKHVFTVTGGGAMHLNDSLGHHKDLKCIYDHHEQACAIAAESYTRYSGELAAVCVTTGPGGTNALTGVLGGWLDSIPMFIVSGQVKRETTVWSTDLPLRQLGDQEYNIIDSVKPMTKYAKMVTEPEQIAYHLEKALFISKSGRGGPVWLDIPLDVQGAIVETEELIHFDKSECQDELPPAVEKETIDKIIDKIKSSKRPVLIAGTGIRLGHSYDDFLKLIDKLNIPVVTPWNGHDILFDEHRLFCGRPGIMGTRGGNFVVENSDLLISLGCRLSIRQVSYNYKNFAKNAYKIMVDIDKAELQKPTLSIDLPIYADAKDVIEKLFASGFVNENNEHKTWLDWCRKINAKYPTCLPKYYETKTPVNPYAFVDTLFETLPEDETIVCGNGSACVVAFQVARLKKGQRLFTNSGCASMGYGFPAAIGTAVFKNGGRVICLDGDGSFQMNLQEMQTLVHNNLNIKIFYFNNSGYHSIRQTQTNLFSQHPLVGVSKENGVSFPDCEKIANCYGVPYFKIDNIDMAKSKIEKVLNTKGPVTCEVILDTTQNFEPKLSSRALPDGTMISPPIDDMFPFLNRSEYAQNKNLHI
ncbi:MAG: Acetolactate synthase isozyme 1 large subunit [Eubacteriales bacterium SKADARSKE-1]|nr:Acetolactate synthase isozyme 1 large subunit [Eubacteriales bacterium SKADARSKE-1]